MLEKREIGCTPALCRRVDRKIWNQRLSLDPPGKPACEPSKGFHGAGGLAPVGLWGLGRTLERCSDSPRPALHHQLRQAGPFCNYPALALSLPSVDQAPLGAGGLWSMTVTATVATRPCCLCAASICFPAADLVCPADPRDTGPCVLIGFAPTPLGIRALSSAGRSFLSHRAPLGAHPPDSGHASSPENPPEPLALPLSPQL